MALTLRGEIPYPDVEGWETTVVFPQETNPTLYRKLAALPEGATGQVLATEGLVSIVLDPVKGQPDAHERISEVLSGLDYINVVRHESELLMWSFPKNERNRRLLEDDETKVLPTAPVAAPAPIAATLAKPTIEKKPGDTAVGLNTGDTAKIKAQTDAKPAAAKPSGPRKLTEEEKAKVQGAQSADSASAAKLALKHRYGSSFGK